MKLYHFTCDHGREGIGARGELTPQGDHPFLGCRVIWLTSDPWPDRDAAGLTSDLVRCDRMEFRYVVSDLDRCRPWIGSPEREGTDPDVVADLERYGRPETWWLTDGCGARLG